MKKKFDVLINIIGTATATIYANSQEEAEEMAVDGKWEDAELEHWETGSVAAVTEVPDA